jgi:hypothetical protein
MKALAHLPEHVRLKEEVPKELVVKGFYAADLAPGVVVNRYA